MKKRCLAFIGIFLASAVSGQNFTGGYDTLFFSKPLAKKMYYRISQPELTEISLQGNTTDHRNQSSKQAVGNALTGVAAFLIPGNFSLGSEKDVIWEVSCYLACNDANLNWKVSLFCGGKIEKEREKVANDDGSHSMEVTRTEYFEWDNGAVGLILDKNDTIGRFSIIMDPLTNQYLKPWSDTIYSQKPVPVHTESKKKGYRYKLSRPCVNYAIIGLFRDKDFMLITNGRVRKSYYFIGNELVCIFQPDVDDYHVKEPDRVVPYLLLSSSIPLSEQPDWYRMAVLSRFLNSKLESNTHVH